MNENPDVRLIKDDIPKRLFFPDVMQKINDMKTIKQHGGDCFVMPQEFYASLKAQYETKVGVAITSLASIIGVPVYVEETEVLVLQKCHQLQSQGFKPVPVTLSEAPKPVKSKPIFKEKK